MFPAVVVKTLVLVIAGCLAVFADAAAASDPACHEPASGVRGNGFRDASFKLVQVCDGSGASELYAGDKTFEGVVYIGQSSPMTPDRITFGTWSEDAVVQFIVNGTDINRLHLLPQNTCGHLNATFRVRKIRVDLTDTDNAGAYLEEFVIITLGKFVKDAASKCSNEL